jgi:hypothetical protein
VLRDGTPGDATDDDRIGNERAAAAPATTTTIAAGALDEFRFDGRRRLDLPTTVVTDRVRLQRDGAAVIGRRRRIVRGGPLAVSSDWPPSRPVTRRISRSRDRSCIRFC